MPANIYGASLHAKQRASTVSIVAQLLSTTAQHDEYCYSLYTKRKVRLGEVKELTQSYTGGKQVMQAGTR